MAAAPRDAIGPRLDSGQQEALRWLAILAMAIDHVGAILLPADVAQPLRFVGRIAWPLFAFLMAYNVAARGVDPRRYLRPLLLWGAVAQLPHYLAFDLFVISILGTLFLAASALALLQAGVERRLAPHVQIGGLIGVALLSTQVEYGPTGVALVIALWWAVRSGTAAAWLVAVVITALVNYPSPNWPAALLALPLAFLAGSLPVRLPRSGGLPWVFYPAHLLALWLISLLIA